MTEPAQRALALEPGRFRYAYRTVRAARRRDVTRSIENRMETITSMAQPRGDAFSSSRPSRTRSPHAGPASLSHPHRPWTAQLERRPCAPRRVSTSSAPVAYQMTRPRSKRTKNKQNMTNTRSFCSRTAASPDAPLVDSRYGPQRIYYIGLEQDDIFVSSIHPFTTRSREPVLRPLPLRIRGRGAVNPPADRASSVVRCGPGGCRTGRRRPRPPRPSTYGDALRPFIARPSHNLAQSRLGRLA